MEIDLKGSWFVKILTMVRVRAKIAICEAINVELLRSSENI